MKVRAFALLLATAGLVAVLHAQKPAASGGPALRASLLADLKARNEEVGGLLTSGGFGGIWFPALQAKDIALDLQKQGPTSGPQSAALEEQVKHLVVAAYELDRDGDLGDKQKITEAYDRFNAAITAIRAVFGAKP